MTQERELHEAESDLAWWRSIFDPIGYRVHGWTYRKSAQVISPDGRYVSVDGDVLALISAARATPATREDELEAVADAIDEARYRHPEFPRERPRPFAEAGESDREYALRLARAAILSLNPTPAAEPPLASEIAQMISALRGCILGASATDDLDEVLLKAIALLERIASLSSRERGGAND